MNEELGIMNGGICRPCLKRGNASFIRHSSFLIPRFREGFTLVEMLIVVAILAVLMTIVFRLGSLGGSDSKRTKTIVKLQKVENCLSGYYAAFGSYPPVRMHGWADINKPVDANGDQSESGGGKANEGTGLVWNRVNAACRCQPFGCEYPPSTRDTTPSGEQSEEEIIEEWAAEIASRIGNSDYPKYSQSEWSFATLPWGSVKGPRYGQGGIDKDSDPSWKATKCFKFGVMSFLLPRYLFMMGGSKDFFKGEFAQWDGNNDLPSDPMQGSPYDDWHEVIGNAQYGTAENSINRDDLAKVVNIPSQAVCARWMPNLEGLCSSLKEMKFFGIKVGTGGGLSAGWEGDDGEMHPPSPCTHYYPDSGSGGTPYRNASVTIYDGWGREFYYYSPPPYQSYTLWSAGANGYTFPPWMDRKDYNDKDVSGTWNSEKKKPCTVAECVADDIMQMSH